MHRKEHNIFIRIHAFNGEQYLLRTLVLAIALSFMGYAYFVSLSIFNVIAHKEAIAESERLESKVGMLEEEYFALAKTVTPEIASAMGMSETAETTFVRRPGAVGTTQSPRGL